MTHTLPDGPTNPRLTALPEEHTTIVTQPGYGPPVSSPPGSLVAEPGAEPTPTGRVYATGEGRYQACPPAGTDRGRTTIADDVVERVIDRIVAVAVAEVTGVCGLFATEGQPVTVRLDDAQTVIDISIQVEFGCAVHEVVEQLRNEVIGQAERLLALTGTEVNVLVADVTFEVSD